MFNLDVFPTHNTACHLHLNKMSTYPVHLIDASKDYQKLFLAYLLVFRDVLDGQKLADSLSELLEIGDWRKLGGRLRRNVQHLDTPVIMKAKTHI